MNEWILVLTFSLLSQPGEIRDISPEVVPGFQSKATCETAAHAISEQLILLAGKAREQQGIAKNTSKSGPSIFFECIPIQK